MQITVDELLDLTLIFDKVEIITNGQIGGGGTVLIPARKMIWDDSEYEQYADEIVKNIRPRSGNVLQVEI